MSTKLITDRIKLAEHARNLHRVTPDEGTALEEVLNPGYWVHVGAKLVQGDKLEILPADGAWYAEALVLSCSRIHAKLAVLNHKVFFEPAKKVGNAPASKDPFEVSFKGPQRKWSVIRTADKTYVKEGFGEKEEALKWLEENQADLLG